MSPPRALVLVAALAAIAPAGPAAAQAPPECPPSVGSLSLIEHDVVDSGPSRVLQCAYHERTDAGETSVSMTVTWQVKEGSAAFVGAGPCTGETLRDDANASLSVAGDTGTVGSYAGASFYPTGGRSRFTPVPEAFTAVMQRLVEQAEKVALPCEGEDGAPAQTTADESPAEPAPATTGDSDTEEALLIAAGLILALLGGGLGFGRVARVLSGISSRRAAGSARRRSGASPPTTPAPPPLEPVQRPRPPPPPREPPATPPASPAQLRALDAAFADTVRTRLEEGYWVRNPDLLSKVWNTIRHPFWGTKSGQCGEFAAKGVGWMRDHVQEQFGPGAIVDEVFMARRSVFVPNPDALDTLDSLIPVNHAATRVILPDGHRVILDFWDALGPSKDQPPRMVPERDWVEKWRARIPSGQISRSYMEQALRNNILDMGEARGIDAFRRTSAAKGQGQEAESIVNSWSVDPW